MVATNFECSSVEQFSALRGVSKSNDLFGVLHLNVQRVARLDKFDRFKDYVNSIREIPMILGLSETWFRPSETGEFSTGNSVKLYEIAGYRSVFCSRDGRSAGVAMYVRDSFDFEVLQKSNGPVSFIHLRLKLGSQRKDLFITYIYMPKYSDYPLLFSFLETICQNLNTKKHLILGDFNIDLNSTTNASDQYKQLLYSLGYEVTNTSVTRPSSNSLIDHVLANFHIDSNYTIQNELSDHNGIFSCIFLLI